jgi:hypothetical protein
MNEQEKQALYLAWWEDLEELSPVQNRWLRMYTRPSVTVILENWAKNQPTDFSLEYLLTHAIESQWQLTEEGWKKAEELGLLADRRKESGDADIENAENWLTHKQAVAQLHKETSTKFSPGSLKTRITKMADKGKLRTNGKKGRDRRFLKLDIDSLELRLRNECLKLADDVD